MKIAGLDIGTTGCKCTVFDSEGRYLNKAYRDYPIRRSMGVHEVDVSNIMESVYEVLTEMAKCYPDIAGIGVTSFGETFVCVDESGIPLHAAMLYTDPRGGKECQRLKDILGEKEIAYTTGLRPHEMYSISKIMWIKNHCPKIYQAASKILLMADYVVYHLTGKAQIDFSLAARTMAFDIRRLTWSKEIFEAAGVDVSLMSKPVPSGTTAGCLISKAAERTGLGENTQIISVGHDQVAAAAGAGAFDEKIAVDGAGTVECLTPVYNEIPDIDVMYQGYYSVVPYVIPGKYVAYAFSYTGGALMQWCVETLEKKETELAKGQGVSVNEYLENEYIKTRGDIPSGLLVLPHFAGAATPYMDTGSKGAILGLTMDTTSADIYRACMEGIAFEMRLNMDKLNGSGLEFEKLHATGGGAHSAVWMQMKADILNTPITALETVDAGTVGCAMLTGAAIGVFEDLEAAAACMVKETVTYYPREHMHQEYMCIYAKYKKVYQAVRPLS